MSNDTNNSGAVFPVLKNDVIIEAGARIALGDLRSIPLTNLPRAGAFMAARLRVLNTLCAAALDKDGSFLGDILLKLGERREPPPISSEVIALCKKTEASFLLIGASRTFSGKFILSLNELYAELLRHGVTIIDVIEVENGTFASVIKSLSNNAGGYYKAFIQK